MKKLKVFLWICVLILCLTACSNDTQNIPAFENEDALLTHLNGMWITDDSENTEYYIFQDGDVYNVSGEELTDVIEDLADDILNKYGIDGLATFDYQTVLTTLDNQKMLGKKSRCSIDPARGMITLNQGKGTEKIIIVENNTVCVKYKTVDWTKNLTKISDTVDFSNESFVNFYDDIKKNYTIPASKFWLPPKEYADSIKDSVITWLWSLVSQDEESEVYSLDIPNRTGVFSVNKEVFMYSETFSYSTYFGTEKMSFLIQYDPYTANKSEFSITDTTSPDHNAMIEHAVFVTRNFPGAPDFQELYDMLMNATANVSNNTKTVEKSIGGITYKLSMGTDGSWGQIFVDAPIEFKLSEIMQYYTPERPSCFHDYAQATCTKPATCNKCGTTQGTTAEHSWTAIVETINDETFVTGHRCTVCGATK